MDLEDLEAEISIILDQMEGPQGDYHEIYLRVRQILQQLQSLGMPPPEDLVRLENRLEAIMEEEKAQALGDQSSGEQEKQE